VSDEPDENALETNWYKLATELEAASEPDRAAGNGNATAEQTTRHLKLVVKDALDAARRVRRKKRR